MVFHAIDKEQYYCAQHDSKHFPHSFWSKCFIYYFFLIFFLYELFPFLSMEQESRDYPSPACFSVFLNSWITDLVSSHFPILLYFLPYMGTNYLLHQVIGSLKFQTLLSTKRVVSSALKDLFERSHDQRIQTDTDREVLKQSISSVVT